mgnify:CR=1 FL=1
MPANSNRMNKINEELKKEIGEIIVLLGAILFKILK